jgi:hypothetical protein
MRDRARWRVGNSHHQPTEKIMTRFFEYQRGHFVNLAEVRRAELSLLTPCNIDDPAAPTFIVNLYCSGGELMQLELRYDDLQAMQRELRKDCVQYDADGMPRIPVVQ